MATESKVSRGKQGGPRKTTATAPSPSPAGKKPTISPAKRWLLIRENAYARAQRRGFVGGNPFEDWLAAEREVDREHATDFQAVFSLTDTTEIAEQFKGIFAAYGLGHLSVDAFLDEHAEGMKRLAAFNRTLFDGTSELASQQSALFKDAVGEAVRTLQSFAQGRVSTEGVAKQAELSTKAIENALSHLRALTESVTGLTQTPRKKGDR